MKHLLLFISLTIFSFSLNGQIHFTKSFDNKLSHFNLEVLEPEGEWMKIINLRENDFMDYDIVFEATPETEIRIQIQEDNFIKSPKFEIHRLIASIATNEGDSIIEYTEYPWRRANKDYNADYAMYVDFVPKESFSKHKNARALFLYKRNVGFVKYIILYNEGLNPFFNKPIRFKRSIK